MDGRASEILTASRFENWRRVLDLSRSFSAQTPADIPVVAAILDSCAAVECRRSAKEILRGKLITPQFSEFAEAWIDFRARNPHRAKDRFEALTNDARVSWLGIYGLLCYAIESENVEILRSTLEKSRSLQNEEELVEAKIADATLTLATLTYDVDRMPGLIASLQKKASKGETLFAATTDLIRKDELSTAKKAINEYVAQFGYDHAAAQADVDHGAVLLSPRDLLSEIDRRLKRNGNYWTLRFERASALQELGDASGAIASIEAAKAIPVSLAYARLQRIAFMARESREYAEQIISDLDALTGMYQDYPLFHVAAAEAFVSRNNSPRAIQHLDTAVRQTPRYLRAILARASLAMKVGDISEAIRLYSRAASIDQNNVFVRIYFTHALIVAKAFAEAKQQLTKVRMSRRYVPLEHIEQLDRLINEGEGQKGG